MTLRDLYPSIEPFNTGFLDVGSGHSIYYEESGNRQGKPALFLHGGPGGGTQPNNRRFWDPEFWRIILFDQRGCGKSAPHASLENNTTWDLVGDIEKLRQYLVVDSWQVFGGSWGSTLALSYATKFPEKVTGLILRGIFLLRKKEIDWLYQEGASRLFPDAWQGYLEPIPKNERGDLLSAYAKRLTHENESIRLSAAQAWSRWELATCLLIPDEEVIKHVEDEAFALAFARIENHYFTNHGFLEEDGFLLKDKQIEKIKDIPGVIVHGRYDVVCPVESAWELNQAWPNSRLSIVADAGHSAKEPGIVHELVSATDEFKKRCN